MNEDEYMAAENLRRKYDDPEFVSRMEVGLREVHSRALERLEILESSGGVRYNF